jgi:hypothetical protein
MHIRVSNPIMLFMLLSLSAWCGSVLAETSLEYQDRGDRYEGVKPEPVSASVSEIELISAEVAHKEEAKEMPDQLKVRFYLRRPSEVFLTVRELDNKYYYWMDEVQPLEPWRPGFDNVFEWSTKEVIQPLGDIGMYDLGVVARLERRKPGMVERIAPVIFYHSHVPMAVEGYRFTLIAGGDARLTSHIYEEGENEPMHTEIFRRQRGGRPFIVRWVSGRARKGPYKLVIGGYRLDNNEPVDLTVHFYHQPEVE